MNPWIQMSIDYANQKSYLDDLFRVYPTIPDGIRELDNKIWNDIEQAFYSRNNINLIKTLLNLDLFPIKDSYIAYLRRDKSAINRNPETINRISGRLYEMGLSEIFKRSSEPKETNRQIGPLFKKWLNSKALGIDPVNRDKFLSNNHNAILAGNDQELMDFAKTHLNYNRNKGLDFIGRFNKKYVIGEAKFLTDFGGHQNAQFNDAIYTLQSQNIKAVKIAILDGVLYIDRKNKMFSELTSTYKNYNIMSSLVLREFLYNI